MSASEGVERAVRAVHLRHTFRALRDMWGPDEAERSLTAVLSGSTKPTDAVSMKARDLSAAVRATVELQDHMVSGPSPDLTVLAAPPAIVTVWLVFMKHNPGCPPELEVVCATEARAKEALERLAEGAVYRDDLFIEEIPVL